MAFKVVRTFALPVTDYEQEVMQEIGATMEVASFAIGRATTEEEVLSLSRDADAVISVFEPFTRSVIERLEKCRVITNLGVGYQNIDVAAATDCGVCVANNPEYCLEEVSDHVIALLLSLARKLPSLDRAVHAGKTGADMARARGQVFRLRGQTLGLVGFGRIPRTLVPKARSFGFKIIAYSPHVPPEIAKDSGVELVDFNRLLEESDCISVHAALTRENEGMFGLEQFKKMKPTAFFINTARGALVDLSALNTALSEGLIAGAGLDVTEPEPINRDNPLLKLENVIFTSHSAYYSETSVVEQRKRPIEEIARVLTGEWPRALVNPQVKEKFTNRWGSQ